MSTRNCFGFSARSFSLISRLSVAEFFSASTKAWPTSETISYGPRRVLEARGIEIIYRFDGDVTSVSLCGIGGRASCANCFSSHHRELRGRASPRLGRRHLRRVTRAETSLRTRQVAAVLFRIEQSDPKGIIEMVAKLRGLALSSRPCRADVARRVRAVGALGIRNLKKRRKKA